jgi:hypothetical protein
VSSGGHSGASLLERRARWLVGAYPAAYRADRGEEIVGTLLEAAPPGRNWPSPREAVSVIAAGLRARREANLRQGLPASLRQTAVIGAAVYLVQLPCSALGEVVTAGRAGFLPFPLGSYLSFLYLVSVMAALLLAAAWSGQRRLIAAAAAAAVVIAVLRTATSHEWDLMAVLVAFAGPAFAVFMPLARRTERLPASLLWLPGLPLLLVLARDLSTPYSVPSFQSVSQLTLLFPYTTYLSLASVIVAVCWLATDVRPLAGLAFGFAVTRLIYAVAYARSAGAAERSEVVIAITASLVIAAALVWLLRRRTQASPPMTS